MAKTPISSATSYLPAAEFLKRCDLRTVAELCSDTGTPIGADSLGVINPATLATNVNLLACLNDASGMVETAALRGQMYSASDLAALTGVGQALLYRIVTDIAKAFLYERRPDFKQDQEVLKRANIWLSELADGVKIFGFSEAAAAGVMEAQPVYPSQVRSRFGMTQINRGLFGHRANQQEDQVN